MSHIDWPDLVRVEVNEADWAALSRGERPKDSVCELNVADRKGRTHVLRTEAGAGFYLLWSALLAFSDSSQK